MKYTVLYKSNGNVLAVVSEQSDLESLKIGTFDIPDGHIIDSIDVSGKEHTAVTHATPMADMANILPIFKKGVKRSLKEKGHPELADDNAELATPSNAERIEE
jgi:hypothetical protein|nr:MAG TPA: hypothetical protein [Caudoviricetes sp.]